jgi:50S ribosomal protein L16 3-hydroxylase
MSHDFTLDWSDFLATHWQKRPTVIRQGFRHFIDPLTPEELAGLAMDESVDSRLVVKGADGWQVEHGPFEDYEAYGEANWSLLVQAVDHWYPPVAELMEPFRCLPNWRIDDLMISFSLPGGGVGPHLDQYDVFIIQGQGRRHWRVGEKVPMKQHCPHPDLLQVDPFEPIIDVELEPGDILYIPPGFPHDGYAIEPSLNYSVGFRAPNQRDLFSSFADHLLAEESGSLRYSDPQLQCSQTPGAISEAETQALRQLMQQLLQGDEFAPWLASYLSQGRHELDLQAVEPPFDEGEIYDRLQSGEVLNKLGGLRTLYLETDPGSCFIHGERLELPAGAVRLARQLCDATHFSLENQESELQEPALLAWLTSLINSGYWYFASDWQAENDEE